MYSTAFDLLYQVILEVKDDLAYRLLVGTCNPWFDQLYWYCSDLSFKFGFLLYLPLYRFFHFNVRCLLSLM